MPSTFDTGLGDAREDKTSNEIMNAVTSKYAAEAYELRFLGGTWSIQHSHFWPATGRLKDYVTSCADPCPLRAGTHIRRYAWTGDPIEDPIEPRKGLD